MGIQEMVAVGALSNSGNVISGRYCIPVAPVFCRAAYITWWVNNVYI